jgi:CHAT domain-containing protein
MPLTDTEVALSRLIEQLAASDNPLSVRDLFSQHPELRKRTTILQIADSVNQLAREDLSRAERLAQAGICMADLLGDDFCRGRTGRAAGNVQVLRGKYSDALETFQNALVLFHKLGEELEVAATLSSSLQPLIYLGRYSDAFKKAQTAREIAERHHDELFLARLEINFGNIFHRQDRFAEAVQHYECALVTLDRLGQLRDCAVGWVNLAVCYISLNEFRKAETAYQNARSISAQQDMPAIVAQADYNIAYLHYYRGEHNQAIHRYQQTRLYCERVGDQYHASLCDLDQSEMYLELHLNVEGGELAQRAFESFEKMKMGYEAAKALAFLGIASYQDGKNFGALEILAAAQERMTREQNEAWVAILHFYQALILRQEGRFYEALRTCKAAQTFYSRFPHAGKAVLIEVLRASLHLDLEDTLEAQKWSHAAVQSAEKLQSAVLLADAYWTLGRVEEFCGLQRESYSSYLHSLHFLEAVPSRLAAEELKIPFSKNRLALYEALVSLAPVSSQRITDLESVFELVEKAKSRDLAEQIAFRINTIPVSSKGRSALAEQVKTLREELNWFYRQTDSVDLRPAANTAGLAEGLRRSIRARENALVKTLDELHVSDEEFHAIQTASTVPLDRIREALSPDELILEYFQARGSVYACVLHRDRLHIAPVTTVQRVRHLLHSLEEQWSKFRLGEDHIRKFSGMLSESSTFTFGALYDELIGPVATYLRNDRLVIIADGLLNYLPFHAFFDGTRYLGQSHVISYAGSASLYCLALSKSNTLHNHDLILSPIPHSDSDAEVLRRVASTLVLSRSFVGPNASMETLRANAAGSRFIHFGTYLASRQDNWLFSKIFVGETQMSILDVYNLRLPCSLLGLTGTGPGLHSSGSGAETNILARGFEYAGARSVLMPLWNVEGDSTAAFLGSFYQTADSESDKALAFQKAMADVRHEFPLPYYWASFILRGATGRSRESAGP